MDQKSVEGKKKSGLAVFAYIVGLLFSLVVAIWLSLEFHVDLFFAVKGLLELLLDVVEHVRLR